MGDSREHPLVRDAIRKALTQPHWKRTAGAVEVGIEDAITDIVYELTHLPPGPLEMLILQSIANQAMTAPRLCFMCSTILVNGVCPKCRNEHAG